ncbi:MAG: trypsin-like peptidase domain-containing protein [Phaeodactylibacter sp.]|nr:trypsin-like peptidase domain-containing protein [Phaeodactylibacter sp.]
MARIYENTDHRPDEEIVLLRDERQRVRDATRAPFRWICSLEVEFPEPVLYPLGTLEHPGKGWKDLKPTLKGCGSGLLITPGHVLTASHVIAGLKVVKDVETGKARFKMVPAKRVIAIPGRNEEAKGNSRPFGAYASRRILVNPGFRTTMELPAAQLTKAQVRKALASDFGVLELQENRKGGALLPGLSAGWWGELPGYKIRPVAGAFRRELQSAKVHIGGYPGEKARAPCSVPWYSTDKVVEAFPKFRGRPESLLLYQADTSAGMSGSPVWVKGKDGRFYLVAVHSSFLDYKAGRMGRVNVGALVTKEMMRQLRDWEVGCLEMIIS